MGIGRIFYEDWERFCERRSSKTLYQLYNIGTGCRSMGVLTEYDMDGTLEALHVEPLSLPNLVILADMFNRLVHECVFGTPAPDTVDCFTLVPLLDGKVDTEFMERCISSSTIGLPDFATLAIPFVVRFRISGRLYCITDVMHQQTPSDVNMTVNSYSCASVMSVADFYRSKYNLDVSSTSSVLCGRMGPCIIAQPLLETEPIQHAPSTSSPVYLVSDYCDIHPFTEVYHLLSLIPRQLFWVEQQLVARHVSRHLFPTLRSSSSIITLTSCALTCPSAQIPGQSYERLEWLGDAVWRVVIAKEGRSGQYSKLMGNDFIGERVAETYPELVDKYILTNTPSLKSPQRARSRLQNQRILADIAEALLAVGFLIGGLACAAEAARILGLFNDSVDPGSPPSDCHAEQNELRLKLSDEIFHELPSSSVSEMHDLRKARLKASKPSSSN
jgi:dsRNA-specific ribonuclease